MHFIAVTAIALLIGIVGAITGTLDVGPFQTAADVGGRHGSDLLAFFFPAAQNMLNGHPFSIYAVRFLGSYPNYNPPLGTVLMAPLLAIGQALFPSSGACVVANYASVACRPLLAIVAIGFMPFVVLLGVALVAALRAADASIGAGQQLVAYALILFSPLIWQDFTIWWHLEQPMMLFFFVAGVTQLRDRPALAGVFLGLALLTRTTAAVPLVALLALLALERAWPTLVRVAGLAAAVAAIGFAPFFLLDRADTTYALLQWRGGAPIGNSVWSIFIHTPLESLARHADLPVAVLFAVGVAWIARTRWHLSAFSVDVWGVLALAALATPMLSKTIWPYYALEPFVLLTIWEYGTLRAMPQGIWRWPILSLGYLGMAVTLGQFIGLSTGGGVLLRAVGVTQFIATLMVALAIGARFEQAEGSSRSGPSLARESSSITRSDALR